jgi:hypothetical protein
VTGAKLADNSVTTTKVPDNALTGADINESSLTNVGNSQGLASAAKDLPAGW